MKGFQDHTRHIFFEASIQRVRALARASTTAFPRCQFPYPEIWIDSALIQISHFTFLSAFSQEDQPASQSFPASSLLALISRKHTQVWYTAMSIPLHQNYKRKHIRISLNWLCRQSHTANVDLKNTLLRLEHFY